jgi:Sporulation and spore germination
MIPRHQTILFIILLVASIVLGAVLWTTLDRAHKRLLEGENSAPTQAPEVAPDQQATLMVANDADNSVTPRVFALPLPQNPEARARALLSKLLDLYAAPGSPHPVPGSTGSVAQVFLLPATGKTSAGSPAYPRRTGATSNSDPGSSTGSELAVVNLTSAFVASHPSGLETETLTILSICATLRANLPRVTEVRFLVDGQPRATLADHADLSRTYLTSETVATEGTQP